MENAVGMEEQKRGSAPENAIELAERVSRLEEKVEEIAVYLSGTTSEEFEKVWGFLVEQRQEAEEDTIRQHCNENGLNYDDAADYAIAVSTVKAKSLYYSPLGFVGGNMGPKNGTGMDALKEVGMARRDLQRFRELDREIQEIDAMYQKHRNEENASAKAALRMRKIILDFISKAEHPYVKSQLEANHLKVILASESQVKQKGYNFIKSSYDNFLKSHKLLNWLIKVGQ